MTAKMNRLVCPTCGLECWTPSAYTCCDGCQTVFYASESAHKRQSQPAAYVPTFSPYDLSGTADKE